MSDLVRESMITTVMKQTKELVFCCHDEDETKIQRCNIEHCWVLSDAKDTVRRYLTFPEAVLNAEVKTGTFFHEWTIITDTYV